MKKRLLILLLYLLSIPFYAQYWEPQVSGVIANLNDVKCITEDNVVIVGTGGTILKTTDGGAHWIQKISGTTADLEKVEFINSTVGYAVGWGGTILKSIDGGENWISINLGLTTNLYGLSCINENTFYISGDNGLIKKTNDGGITFIDQSYVTTHPINTIQFLNEQVGYASSFDPYGNSNETTYIKTIDAGETWISTPNQGINFFYFLTENIGFIRDGGGIYKTIDGGLNSVYIATTGQLTTDIFSLNENIIWNVENSYALCGCSYFCINKIDLNLAPELQQATYCYSDNDGETAFRAIHFASDTKGYAVGDWGKILKNSTGLMETMATNQFDKKEYFKMFPNPTTNQINISFLEKQTQPFSVEITDFLGKKVFSKSYENQYDTTINIESFSLGVYFVKLKSIKGNSIQKLIKE